MVRERKIGPGDHAKEPPEEAAKGPAKDSGKKARKSDPSDIPFESQPDPSDTDPADQDQAEPITAEPITAEPNKVDPNKVDPGKTLGLGATRSENDSVLRPKRIDEMIGQREVME
ncbi:MAG: hypothetical protein LW720_08685, partial [Pirellula sp.]|nr:hypothetical protein [Pirellula sp.]